MSPPASYVASSSLRTSHPSDRVDVSVLVPAKDEAENLPIFMEQAALAFAASPLNTYEVIVIDDGSDDDTWAVLQRLTTQYSFLRTVRHRTRRGIADALRTGYLHARGAVLVFYPADMQFKPEDIPRLVAPILADDADMVTGFKQGKYEKQFVSGIYNALSRTLFHVPVKDLNSVKAYRREIMDALPVRPDWHRYMIVIAAAQGFTVTEIPVPVYPRHAGKSKFGLSRIPDRRPRHGVGLVRAQVRQEAIPSLWHDGGGDLLHRAHRRSRRPGVGCDFATRAARDPSGMDDHSNLVDPRQHLLHGGFAWRTDRRTTRRSS